MNMHIEGTGYAVWREEGTAYLYIQLSVIPLHLLDDVQSAVQDELVQVAGLIREARLPIAALLGSAELVLEEGVVLGADDGKVVGHGSVIDRSSGRHLPLLFLLPCLLRNTPLTGRTEGRNGSAFV